MAQVAFLCLFLLLAFPAYAGQVPTVLLINSYHQEYDWVEGYSKAFAEGIGDAAEIVTFDMDTKRLPDSAFSERARLALDIVDNLKPNVVVTGDDNALKLLGKDILARGYPLVYLGINNNPRFYIGTTDMATGVLERPLLKRSIIFLQEIFGDRLSRCLVLFDVSTTSEVIRETTFKGADSISFSGIEVGLKRTNDWGEWQETVKNARQEGYDAIILGLYHRLRDDAGRSVPSDEVIAWTCENSPVPPFGFWANSIGPDRAVGGMVLSSVPQGQIAAGMVRAVLVGEPVGNVHPVMAEQGQFLFSRKRLDEWNIVLPESIRSQAEFTN